MNVSQVMEIIQSPHHVPQNSGYHGLLEAILEWLCGVHDVCTRTYEGRRGAEIYRPGQNFCNKILSSMRITLPNA